MTDEGEMLSFMQKVEKLLHTPGAGPELAALLKGHDKELSAQTAFVYCAAHGALAHSLQSAGKAADALEHARMCFTRVGEEESFFFGTARAHHIIRYVDLARSVGGQSERVKAAEILPGPFAMREIVHDCDLHLSAQLVMRLLWARTREADALAEITLSHFALDSLQTYCSQVVANLWLERAAAAPSDLLEALYRQTGLAIQAAATKVKVKA